VFAANHLWVAKSLNTYLINQMVALQIDQMRSLFVVGEMRAYPIDHHHYEGAVIHVQPIASSNEFIRSVSCERAIGVSAKVGFVKADHKPESLMDSSD
jgi:hypothetical protein